MATERNAAPMAAFFKFTKKGQKIAGVIESYKTNDKGGFISLRPALLRDDRNGVFQAYAGAAVGLATDLKFKITEHDTRKAVSIEWIDSEPTKKGSPKKIFRVEMLEREELIGLAHGADMSHRQEQYRGREDDDDSIPSDDTSSIDDDDLPF